MPNREFQKKEASAAISCRTARQACFRLLCCKCGTPNNGSALIFNRSANISRDLLRRQTEVRKHYKCQHMAKDFHFVFWSPEDLALQLK